MSSPFEAPNVPDNSTAPFVPSPVATPTSAPTAPHAASFGSEPLADAVQLFIVEVVIIIILCKILAWILSKIKQPSVIAEVISGILLGPTVMGRVKGFSEHIFPPTALPIFNVFANIGLIFFMNLIGLELDFDLMVSEWKRTAVISVATMVIPFVVSIGSSLAVWQSIDKNYQQGKSFGTYLLFMGVAICVTAFPVLARIVKEKQLFRTRLGVTTLATAAWADVAAWTLLALSISLISGGGKLNILWTFLLLLGYSVVMFGPVRWALRKALIRNGEPRPITPSLFAALIVATLCSAWLTAYFGLHSIFGAFIFGIVLPRDGGFCVRLAEKFEDFITAFFLPLYFTASGLRTQLGLLNDGNTWGLLLLLISVAIVTKIGSGCLAARITGLSWRESLTLGVLMNTKGLVELIVLNIGLDNKLISPTTFSMMVVLALVTTFITSPIVHFLYPYDRIIEFENQTPGKTVLLAAIRDRSAVAPMVGVFALIASGRPKKYRLKAIRTMALPDRPSAYMSLAHSDDTLDHVRDVSNVLAIQVKTLPLTYDDSEAQKVKQLVLATSSMHASFFFAAWLFPMGSDGMERIPNSTTIGGDTIRKIYSSSEFSGNMVVLLPRDMPSTLKSAVFVYSGSVHDREAAKLVKAMLHTAGANILVIYAMNSTTHPTKVENPADIKDPILAALFRKVRPATIELLVIHETELTTPIAHALTGLEDPGVVVVGTSLQWLLPSPEGISYRDLISATNVPFLCVTKGSREPVHYEDDPTPESDSGVAMQPVSQNHESSDDSSGSADSREGLSKSNSRTTSRAGSPPPSRRPRPTIGTMEDSSSV